MTTSDLDVKLVRDLDELTGELRGGAVSIGNFDGVHIGHARIIERLKQQGVPFRNDIVSGPGGRQILCEDPSGNVVELFQPA